MNGEIILPPSAWDISIRKIHFSSRSFQPPQDAQTTTEVSFTIITSSVHVVITYVPRHPSWLSCLLQCQVLTTFHSPPLSPSTKNAVLLVSRNGLVIFKIVRLALSQKQRIREGWRHGIAPIPFTSQYRLFSAA